MKPKKAKKTDTSGRLTPNSKVWVKRRGECVQIPLWNVRVGQHYWRHRADCGDTDYASVRRRKRAKPVIRKTPARVRRPKRKTARRR